MPKYKNAKEFYQRNWKDDKFEKISIIWVIFPWAIIGSILGLLIALFIYKN
jgi:ABC-type multidrug transport system permease subunit